MEKRDYGITQLSVEIGRAGHVGLYPEEVERVWHLLQMPKGDQAEMVMAVINCEPGKDAIDVIATDILLKRQEQKRLDARRFGL